MAEHATPGQTVGPFFGIALPYPGGSRLVDDARAVRLHGTVYDGAGEGIPDALVELWQSDPEGRVVQRPGSLRRDGAFTGWGRCATDSGGRYEFSTVTPGGGFFALAIFARGLLDVLFTRAYLPGRLDDASGRRKTMLCQSDSIGYRFDIHLQGPDETVFLAFRREEAR